MSSRQILALFSGGFFVIVYFICVAIFGFVAAFGLGLCIVLAILIGQLSVWFWLYENGHTFETLKGPKT